MDYSAEYDAYWASDERLGTSSFDDVDAIAEEVLGACGTGPILDVGCGMGGLVKALLARGVRAQGVDVSAVAVDFCERLAPGCFRLGSALKLPFDSCAFETVVSTDCLEHLSEADVPAALSELHRVARRFVYLRLATTPDRDGHWHLTVKPRDWWETQCFQAGFRKHAAYYRVNDYGALEHDPWQIVILLEKLPVSAAAAYPLEALADERDLHMDMLRETGRRSDAHVARYDLASRYIRSGDVVLDAAAGLGYGSYLMLNCSCASRVIGIDSSDYAVAYAKANYGGAEPDIEYRHGLLPQALGEIPDHSIDLVVSFETLEHVDASSGLWAEFYRILTPAGRVVVSVPNDWADETGEDPNPQHLHVYSWSRLLAEMCPAFILEAAYAQTASQYKSGNGQDRRWCTGGRELRRYAVRQLRDGAAPECEWCIAVGMRDPADGKGTPYRETTYETYSDDPQWNATAFARDYENPWLVKGLVTIGHRLEDSSALGELARAVMLESPPGSADQGAGLCVLGYKLVACDHLLHEEVQEFDRACTEYFELKPANPHQLRWQISLYYLLGQLWQSVGEFERAARCYGRCRDSDTAAFSPILATKRVDSCLNLGFVELAQGRLDLAYAAWKAGIEIAEHSLQDDWHKAVGDFNRPSDFGLRELAAVVEKASACAFALRYASFAQRRPSQWWWQHQRDRISQIRRLELQNLEVKRLNEVVNGKNAMLDDLAIEVGRLNEVIVQKDTAIATQATEIGRLNEVVVQKDVAIVQQAAEIGRLNEVVVQKDEAIVQQAAEIGRLNEVVAKR